MSLCLSEGLGLFDGEGVVGKVIGTTLVFDEISSWARFHFERLQRSDRLSESVYVVIDVDSSSFNFIESFGAEFFLTILLLDDVKFSPDGIGCRPWSYVLLVVWRSVGVV